MTEHTFEQGLGSLDPGQMDTDIRQAIANEMRALAAAMFGLRFQEEVVLPDPAATDESSSLSGPGLGEVDALGGNIADFDFDQDLGPTRDEEPEPADGDNGDREPAASEPSRWATHEEPTIHNARTRAMLEEIAFLDE